MRGCFLYMPLAVSRKISYPYSTPLPALLAYIVATLRVPPSTSFGIALPMPQLDLKALSISNPPCIDNVPHHMLLGIPGTYDAMPNEHFARPIASDGVDIHVLGSIGITYKGIPNSQALIFLLDSEAMP